jgi:hypothetical protein
MCSRHRGHWFRGVREGSDKVLLAACNSILHLKLLLAIGKHRPYDNYRLESSVQVHDLSLLHPQHLAALTESGHHLWHSWTWRPPVIR